MKRVIFLLLCVLLYSHNIFSQVGIGTTDPDESTILEIVADDRGLLIPKLTTTQRDDIVNPANGLLIYNTDSDEFQFNSNNKATPIWVAFSLSSTSTATPGQSVKYSNTDVATNVNQNTAINLPVASTLEWNDNTTLYNVDTTNHTITINETGRYRIIVNASLIRTAGTARPAPEIRTTVNGTQVGSYGSTGYIRNNAGHTESSLHLNETIELTANDIIAVDIVRTASNGTVRLRSIGSSNIYIEKIL